MRTKTAWFVSSSSLLLITSAMMAQENLAANHATNVAVNSISSAATATNTQTRKDQKVFTDEELLLPPALKEKLKLTEAQRTELKPIEDDFAQTSQEYKAANQPRIDAANEAGQRARAAKDPALILAARTQLQQVWAGLQPYRSTAVVKLRLRLTPGQLKVLAAPQNQWREEPDEAAYDPAVK